jgi:hypothetical protein
MYAVRSVGQRFCCCSPLSLISTLQVRGCAQRYCRSRLAWQVELAKALYDAVSPRVAKTYSAYPLVDCLPFHCSRATAAPQSSRQPPSRCRVSHGLAPDVFLTTVRATFALCQFGGWSTRHDYSLARRSKQWRWPASLVPDARCTPSHFCQPAVQTRRRAPHRAARQPRAPTNKLSARLSSFLCLSIWRIPLGRFDYVSLI